MSSAARRAAPAGRDRSEDWQRWTAAALTVLLHVAALLLVLWMPTFVTTPPRGGAAGGRTAVTYIDDALSVPPPVHAPMVRKTPSRKPAKPRRATTRIQATPVPRADDLATPDLVDIPDDATTPDTQTPQPDDAPAAAPDTPDQPVQRTTQAWGLPPGMLPQDSAAENAGAAPSPGTDRNRSDVAPSSGGAMEVGGYQVYYDVQDQPRLRAWRKQGMTELSLPLPGTRRLMVCSLDIALRREDGQCRLVEPDDPQLKSIGDARDVLVMQRISRLGQVLWNGPGAYR